MKVANEISELIKFTKVRESSLANTQGFASSRQFVKARGQIYKSSQVHNSSSKFVKAHGEMRKRLRVRCDPCADVVAFVCVLFFSVDC